MRIDVSELEELRFDFGKFEKALFNDTMPKAALVFAGEVQAIARRLAPVDLGALRLSIKKDIIQRGDHIIVEVGPTQRYGKDIELGRDAHYVSPATLAPWAKRKGVNPYAVSAIIAKKGTKAQPFMGPAIEATKGLDDKYLDVAIQEAIKIGFNI